MIDIKNFKMSDFKAEHLFLLFGIVFGLFFVFENPPFHTNDEDRHFYYAYQISTGQLFAEANVKEQKVGCELPKNLYSVVSSFQGVPYQNRTKISSAQLDNAKSVDLNKNDIMFINHFHYGTRQFSFMPSAIGILFGRIFGAGPIWLGWWGRIFGLVCYLTIIFYAIKNTPIFKGVFILYALSPMALFQGASVTYDMMSNSLSLLLVSYFLYLAYDEKSKIGNREFGAILLLAFLHTFAKHGYVFIPFIFFIIPSRKFNKPFNLNYSLVALISFVFFVLLYFIESTWGKIIPDYSHIKQPPFQNDFRFDYANNMKHWIANIPTLISLLYDNILHFRQEWFAGVLGRFGYSYTNLPNEFYMVYGAGLLGAAFIDNDKKITISPYQKLIFLAVAFLNAMALIFQFLLTSPVGAKMIFGFQGRYLVQLVPVFLLVFYQNKINLKQWDENKLAIIGIYLTFALLFVTTFMIESFFTI